MDWDKQASNLLKIELRRKNISYIQLIDLLKKIGIEETYSSLSGKINRGSYKCSFLLQCLQAIGLKPEFIEAGKK